MTACGVATLIIKMEEELKIVRPNSAFEHQAPEILMMKRKGAHGAGMWSIPGGRIEGGEDPKSAAEREVLEETGLAINVVPFDLVPYNNVYAGGEPWLTLFFITVFSIEDGRLPRIMEPAKCGDMRWCSWVDLPKPLFEPFYELVKSVYKKMAKNVWKLGTP